MAREARKDSFGVLFVIMALVLLQGSHLRTILHFDGLIADQKGEPRFKVSLRVHDNLLRIHDHLRVVTSFGVRLISKLDLADKVELSAFETNKFFVKDVSEGGHRAFLVWIDGDPFGSAEVERGR